MPAAEVDVTADLVRRLLADQHPDLADLAIEPLANGWDNVMFRLGPSLAVRLPRREVAARLLANEQQWLPQLAPHLPLPIPAPTRIGRPALGYPWPWSVVSLLPGRIAWHNPPAWDDAARTLATFLRALHTPAAPDAPANPFRGIPLAARSDVDTKNLHTLGDLVDTPAVRRVRDAALAAPRWPGPPVWLHGDLHPANILVNDARITGIIDFGDLTAGDPATDLSVAWMLLPPDHHDTFRTTYKADPHTWTRARGWALALSLAFLSHSSDHPLIAQIGHQTLTATLA